MNQALSDPLRKQAIELVRTSGRASLSELCTKFQIGFQRGQRLMYLMERDGVVTANVPLVGRKVIQNGCEPGRRHDDPRPGRDGEWAISSSKTPMTAEDFDVLGV